MENNGSGIKIIKGNYQSFEHNEYCSKVKRSSSKVHLNTLEDMWDIHMDYLSNQKEPLDGRVIYETLKDNRDYFSWISLVKFDSVRFPQISAGSSLNSIELHNCQEYYIPGEMELYHGGTFYYNGIFFSPSKNDKETVLLAAKTMKKIMFLSGKMDFKIELLLDSLTNGYNSSSGSGAKRSNLRRIIQNKWDINIPINCCGYVAFRSGNGKISREFPLY